MIRKKRSYIGIFGCSRYVDLRSTGFNEYMSFALVKRGLKHVQSTPQSNH